MAGRRKPVVALRPAPAPVRSVVEVAAAERFVSGRGESKAVVLRKDGRALRRMTVYLDPDLRKRLAVHAAEIDGDVSEVIGMACEQFLARRGGS